MLPDEPAAGVTAPPDALLDTAPCGFVSFRDDGTVVTVNRTLLDLLGYAREEVEGTHVERLLTLPGRIFYQTHLFPLVTLHGHADEIFLTLRARDGTDLGALLNSVRRERGGVPVTDCVLLPVRERRKFEDALIEARRVAEQAQARLAEQNRELAMANAQLEQQQVELELQQEQLQVQATEMEAQQATLEATNEELITQAEELEQARAAAEEANHAKSSFLAVMSHELRTPLNAIGGYAELIDMGIHGPVTEAQREALRRIIRGQRHLLRLINNVLNLSRIEAGRVEYAIEDVPLGRVVDLVMPMIEPQLAAKAIRWATHVPPALTARADGEKIQQILINLLTNAMKFTPDGGEVRVEGALDDAAADGHVSLHVHDTGIGIPAEKLPHVFEPFVQVDSSHTRQAEGTGLGLAISRDLARGMGGDLTARSVPGRGSTFTLTLPRGAAPR